MRASTDGMFPLMPFVTKQLPSKVDYLAPDGSEIRLLPSLADGGVCHCTLGADGAPRGRSSGGLDLPVSLGL
jgi:hypothetical protein